MGDRGRKNRHYKARKQARKRAAYFATLVKESFEEVPLGTFDDEKKFITKDKDVN